MQPGLSYDALRQVIVEQQEEAAQIRLQSWIERSLFKQVQEVIDKRWIKVITGVRRSGKSIFAHQILKDRLYGYVNFDDERFIGLLSLDFNKILQFLLECCPGVKTFLFDEMQNIEGWELFVNRLQRQGYNLIITGSNSKLLGKELATHLTGRYISIELFPFSFREFLQAKQFSWSHLSLSKTEERASLYRLLVDYLHHGGFPELVLQGYHAGYLRELYDKIITKDISRRYRVRSSDALREIAVCSHANLGEDITFHKIKNVFGFGSIHTIKKHFQYIQDGYLVFLLKPFTYKYKEPIKQSRKVYTIDNGLCAAINPKFADNKKMVLRNLVFQELYRRGKIFSYYTATGVEVSFVLHTEKHVDSLIHVVWSLQDPSERKQEMKSLIKAAGQLKCTDLSIITWEDENSEEVDGQTIHIFPVWKWLLDLDQKSGQLAHAQLSPTEAWNPNG